jgi:biotin transport system substrate-specific component
MNKKPQGEMMMGLKGFTVRDICYIGIFAAVITVCAQISIPMPYGVPMTLQTFAIPLAGVVLGTRNGTYSALVYVLLGAIGAPVFAGFSGGLRDILGATGGFILSFPLMALAAGIGERKHKKTWLVGGLAAGAIINYICGTLYFTAVMQSDLKTAFIACVLPFIPTAIIKIGLVAVLGKTLKTALVKSKVLAA